MCYFGVNGVLIGLRSLFELSYLVYSKILSLDVYCGKIRLLSLETLCANDELYGGDKPELFALF